MRIESYKRSYSATLRKVFLERKYSLYTSYFRLQHNTIIGSRHDGLATIDI